MPKLIAKGRTLITKSNHIERIISDDNGGSSPVLVHVKKKISKKYIFQALQQSACGNKKILYFGT